MQNTEAQSKPNWRAIAVFYFLACFWSWPFFWWRDVNTASWNAWRLPEEIKGLTQPWGPGLAAIAVFYLFPQVRSRAVSLWGSSWKRSALCFLTPIFFASIAFAFQSKHFSYKLVYYLLVGGFSTLGEEVGWRGFLKGALRPLGRLRGYLLLGVPVGNLALHLAYERHILRGDIPIGNNSSRRRSHHVRPGISNGAHGLGSSRNGRP